MASASGPGDVLQASEDKTRFVRLARLLVCGGTTVMGELFDYITPPANLAAVLSRSDVKKRLTDSKNKNYLTFPQWQNLYPPSGVGSVQSISFDITLLFKLLRENMISGLSAPSTGWDKLPNIGDFSLPADMARLKYYRNGIAHGDEKMELSEQEFSDYWKEIKDALMRIVGYYATSGSSTVTDWETAIDRLLNDPLTEDDRKNVEELSEEELKSYYLESSLETLLKVEEKELPKSEKFKQAKSVLNNLIGKIRLWIPIRESSMKFMKEIADELDDIQEETDSKKYYGDSVGIAGVVSVGVGAVATFFTLGIAAPLIVIGLAATAGGKIVSSRAAIKWLKKNERLLNRVKDVLENDYAKQEEVAREVQTFQDLIKQISQEENISEKEVLKKVLGMFYDKDNNGAEFANLNLDQDLINSICVTFHAVVELSEKWSSLKTDEARAKAIKPDIMPILAAINVYSFVTSASSYLQESKSARKLRETAILLDEDLHKHKDFLINFGYGPSRV